MTDDTTETHIIFQRSLALAEATTGRAMADSSNLGGVPVAHKQKIDTKPDHVNSDIYINGKQETIEVTDGKWKDLWLWRLRNVSASSANNEYKSDIAGVIPANYLLGIPHAEDKYDDAYSVTYSGDYLGHYTWFKINHVKFMMKNFMVLVERDASGGIQLLDDIVFEVRKMYNKAPADINDGEPQNLVTQTLTDLKAGIGMEVPFTQIGYFSKDDICYMQEISKGAVKNQYVGYYYLSHLMGIGNMDNCLFLPQSPLYHYQIRALNLPAGLSNIKVYLGYVWSLSSNVDAIGRNFKTMNMNMPYLGAKWADSGMKTSKKRANEDIKIDNKIVKIKQ